MSALANLLNSPGASLEAAGDWDAVNQLVRDKGWSDGLPVVPPTAERVEAMLGYCDRPWDKPVGAIPPRYGEATPLRLAANAVMAGCRPEYFPVIVATIEAMCEEKFNLYGIQATTHPVAPLLIVNGPIAKELGINAGHNALGPGVQANATIGRAIRLALVNVGGAIPGSGDMSTFGSPAKYTYCVAENEERNPWEPLHVELGFAREASTVTVIGAETPHNVNDHESLSGEGLLRMIAGTIGETGANDIYYEGQPLVIFGPEHAEQVAADGYSKADVKKYFYENGRFPLGRLSHENIERRMRVKFPERFAKAGLDALVPLAQRPEDFLVIVLGGAGKHSAFVPTFGATRAVTRALKRSDGSLAGSINDLRRR
ncbi:MAG: hypothetical protein OEZ08_07165 [Betaproteobacteria bacterium]|nr:hypothetical protein [Betaproteobacteria bacterium]